MVPKRHGVVGVWSEENVTLGTVFVVVKAKDLKESYCLEFSVMPALNLQLPQRILRGWPVPDRARGALADEGFAIPAPVKMILRAGAMAVLLGDESVLIPGGVRWCSSRLGWLGFGGAERPDNGVAAVFSLSTDENLVELVKKFWEIEDGSVLRERSEEEELCEKLFLETHGRDELGRYIVRIPLKKELTGCSRDAAWRRYLAVEKRFDRDRDFKRAYELEMENLLQAGYMIRATREPTGPVYYLPHHAVTTKFRVVYDASCKTDRGASLNECQLIGERLQPDLFEILLRFRSRQFAVSADIKKMYLQVGVQKDQWDLQRIFWREPGKEIAEYWLTRLTFGMASAPHCAVRAMKQCAIDHQSEFPAAADVVHRDFYMDDCLTGADNEEDAQLLVIQLKALLERGGFELCKWRTNDHRIVHGTDGDKEFVLAEGEGSVLGLSWNDQQDMLGFKWKCDAHRMARTKREILRDIARVFDPLGLIGPSVIQARIIMQRLHVAKVSWDEVAPDEYMRPWQVWREQLRVLEEVKVPRWVMSKKAKAVHGFADASTEAYGAVLYLVTTEGEVFLLASRARVAPARNGSIPRLELCAAVLLSKLAKMVQASLGRLVEKWFMWSDSAIVLHWLKRGSDLKVFVHNRVQAVRKNAEGQVWNHVRSEENPADLISRGVPPGELLAAEMWWKGPCWIKNWSCEKADLPELSPIEDGQFRVEIKKPKNTLEKGAKVWKRDAAYVGLIRRGLEENRLRATLQETSRLTRLIRRTCWVRLFVERCKERKKPQNVLTSADWSPIVQNWQFSLEEEEAALQFWVRTEQILFYGCEMKALERKEPLPAHCSLSGLCPYIDGSGILRVLGRLDKSALETARVHPMILPPNSHLAGLIIDEAHRRTLHGGCQVMAVQVRERFWITNMRQACRKHIHRCLPCVRNRKQTMEQLMGSLPEARVTMAPPFGRTGIDYAGPFEVKPELPRSKVVLKRWVAVFVCMVTKAVHLELVDDLSTKAFINAFLRFTAIRGPCNHLFSDNGTTFVGANKELGKMVSSWNEGGSGWKEEMVKRKVRWTFITPSAPHQGGLWEAAVKSLKHHLRRVIGAQRLGGEEFRTLLAQISAVVNSRPISAVTDDPDDMEYLTPGHFLIGRPVAQLFGRRVEEPVSKITDRYLLMQALSRGFWRKWKDEYLHTLQQRTKWKRPQANLEVGDLVLVMEDTPPTVWKTARVVKVSPGTDGLVRTADLRFPDKQRCFARPIQKLVRLPVTDKDHGSMTVVTPSAARPRTDYSQGWDE